MVTEVCGTFVAVLAKHLGALAATEITYVVLTTVLTVVACARIKDVLANTGQRVAAVVGTIVSVITTYGLARSTYAYLAGLGTVTTHAFTTGTSIHMWGDHAAGVCVTSVIGTFLFVTTFEGLTRASTEIASVVARTRITIGARKATLGCLIRASARRRVTVILSTFISVIAIRGITRLT